MFENLKNYQIENIEKLTGGGGDHVDEPPPQN